MTTTRTWSESNIPDLSGMAAVVTGASSGMGLEVARGLASKGAHVLLAVRSPERGRQAAAAIRDRNPSASIDVIQLDLADLASVHRCADAVQLRLDTLDLLINNAGLGSHSLQRTLDGFELVFGTNHLGHFALTGLLMAVILASPKARIVSVSSLAHSSGRIDFENLDGSNGYSDLQAYAQSKLAVLLFAYELQRRLAAAGRHQISVACHPGWAATNMTLKPTDPDEGAFGRLFRAFTRRFASTAAVGALPELFAATSPDVHGGDFIGPGGRFGVSGDPTKVRSSAQSYNEDLARHLWQVSENMTGVRYSFDTAGTGELVAESNAI